MAFPKRAPVSKGRGARAFRKEVKRTRLPNVAQPMRGGFRM